MTHVVTQEKNDGHSGGKWGFMTNRSDVFTVTMMSFAQTATNGGKMSLSDGRR